MRVEGLDALRVVQGAVHAATPRGADHEGHAEVAVGAVVDLGRLAHDLVERGVDEVGELDLGDRAQVGQCQPDGDADDRRLGERCVDHPPVAELGVQPVGGAEHAAARAHVLAEHEHSLVGRHQVVLGLAHRVDDRADGGPFGGRSRCVSATRSPSIRTS